MKTGIRVKLNPELRQEYIEQSPPVERVTLHYHYLLTDSIVFVVQSYDDPICIIHPDGLDATIEVHSKWLIEVQ